MSTVLPDNSVMQAQYSLLGQTTVLVDPAGNTMTNYYMDPEVRPMRILFCSFLALALGCATSPPPFPRALPGSQQALLLAVKANDLPKVKYLLDTGANPNISDMDQTPAIMLAIGPGRIEICRILLGYHADPNAVDFRAWTPLMSACAQRDGQLVRILLSAGANVNAVSESGDSALTIVAACGGVFVDTADTQEGHEARENICHGIAQELLTHGARLNVRGARGTPLEAAKECGNGRILRLLQSYRRSR